jgi:hypothetical protein
VIFITLLARSVPLLQVMFIVLLEDLFIGLTRCGIKLEDHQLDPYHVVSEHWVDHGEYFVLICELFFL